MKTLLILLVAASWAHAQLPNCQKIGYADTDYILQVMPEFNKAKRDIQLDIDQYEKQFNAKVAEFEEKLRIYKNAASSMVDIVRMDKENELKRIQESIDKFQQEVQVAINKRESDLLQPIIAKVGKAINAVGEEGGFDFILNSKSGPAEIVQFANSKFNVSDRVLEKLGIEDIRK